MNFYKSKETFKKPSHIDYFSDYVFMRGYSANYFKKK